MNLIFTSRAKQQRFRLSWKKKIVKTRYFFHRGPGLIERISTNERAR